MRINLQNKKFERLTVKSFFHRDSANKAHWICKCECGKETIVQGYNLTSGHTKSCGCAHTDMLIERNSIHGKSKRAKWHPLYTKWAGILRRCTNQNERAYKNYGGRGIKCLWKDFDSFYEDMVKSFDFHVKEYGLKNTTLDRIDNNGHYCKENCRWATWREQRNNTRNTTYLEYRGENKAISVLADEIGISYRTLRSRLDSGWSTEKALTTPVKSK